MMVSPRISILLVGLISVTNTVLVGANSYGNYKKKNKNLRNKSKKDKDKRDFSWLEGTWYQCDVEFLYNIDGAVAPAAPSGQEGASFCGRAAALIEEVESETGRKGFKYSHELYWPEPCAFLNVADTCPTLLPDGAPDNCVGNSLFDYTLGPPGSTSVRATFYGIVSLNPDEDDSITLYTDHSEYASYNSATESCEWKSTQAQGVEDNDEVVLTKGDKNGNIMYRSVHLQEVRDMGGGGETTFSAQFQTVLAKDMKYCPTACEAGGDY